MSEETTLSHKWINTRHETKPLSIKAIPSPSVQQSSYNSG